MHDIIEYGKELGGEARPRDGMVMREAALEAVSEEQAEGLDRASDGGRVHEGMRANPHAKL